MGDQVEEQGLTEEAADQPDNLARSNFRGLVE